MRAQTDEYGLAQIVDTIEPIGCIMAGDWQRYAPKRGPNGVTPRLRRGERWSRRFRIMSSR